jgi:hypothetical protein
MSVKYASVICNSKNRKRYVIVAGQIANANTLLLRMKFIVLMTVSCIFILMASL